MAKKHKTTKKHRFKYAEPTGLKAAETTPATQTASAKAVAIPKATKGSSVGAPATASAVAAGRDFSYVATDLRRLSILLVSLVLLEGVLWYVLNHTAFGSTVFNLIQV